MTTVHTNIKYTEPCGVVLHSVIAAVDKVTKKRISTNDTVLLKLPLPV